MAVTVLLVLISLAAFCGGLLGLTQATLGVGGIAAACLFAILGRMAQASVYHKQLIEQLEPQRTDALRRSVSAVG